MDCTLYHGVHHPNFTAFGSVSQDDVHTIILKSQMKSFDFDPCPTLISDYFPRRKSGIYYFHICREPAYIWICVCDRIFVCKVDITSICNLLCEKFELCSFNLRPS